MTTTIQPYAVLDDTRKSIAKAEDDIEDNNLLLLSTLDSLNKLCEKLNRLNYLIQSKEKEIKQTTYPKGKGETNED